jgi:DNA-binding response OmpR family regulator
MQRRILVVEDDPAISHMVTKVLELEGYSADVVFEGRQALAAASARPYDAVILDVMLPGLDGLSIMRQIREHPTTAAIPVIMVTARTDDETTWQAWKAGCDYIIAKPFDPADLVEVLGRLAKSSTP